MNFGFAIAKVLNKLIYTNYYIIHHLKFLIKPSTNIQYPFLYLSSYLW